MLKLLCRPERIQFWHGIEQLKHGSNRDNHQGCTPGLPKTRSGKIMRRILRKIAEDDFSNLGDTSTLAEPAVVEDLIENRQNK